MEQRVISGNVEVLKRQLEALLKEGWRVAHLAGGFGYGVSQYVCVVERPKKTK